MDPVVDPSPEAQEVQPGSPEYDALMAVTFEQSQTPATDPAPAANPAPTDRPDWLPAEFETVEDMAKAYAELTATQADPEADPEADPMGDLAPADDAAQAAVAEAGLDFDALSAEFSELGGFSDETYAAFEAKGITASMVDAYAAGQVALAEAQAGQVFAEVGGQDAFADMTAWAGQNMAASEVEAFNSVMDGGNLDAMKLAAAGLRARYEAANGVNPALVSANNTPATSDVFRSWSEVTKQMSDPRYAKDPAFRADVQAKLGRSGTL